MTILCLVGLLAYRDGQTSQEFGRWVRHTHDVLDAISTLTAETTMADSDGRGFALTGDGSYLDHRRASESLARQAEKTLRILTADNDVQQNRLSTLETLIDRRDKFADELADLRRSQGLVAAADAVRSSRSLSLTEDFSTLVAAMRAEELALLRERRTESRESAEWAIELLTVGIMLGLVSTAAGAWSVERDRARRARAEEALHESDENYRGMVQGVEDYGIILLDPKGQVLSWNTGAERMTGCMADQMIGKSFAQYMLPDDIKRGRPEEILRTAEAAGRMEFDGPRVRADGSRFIVRATYTALRDPRGGLRGFALVSRDITQNVESEAKYRSLMEAAPDAMVVVDSRSRIILVNARAENHFGYRRDELLGQNVKKLIPMGFSERRVAVGLPSAQDAPQQQFGAAIELQGRRKDGSEFPIELLLSPLQTVEGIVVTAVIRDITVRRTQDAVLKQKMDELSRSNEELGQFAYIASHDLQEPLRMVASYTQLLAKRYKGRLDADADEFIAFAVDGADRMQRLIQDLLTFSRVGSKGRELRETSSEGALLFALANLRGVIDKSGAVVTHDVLPMVLADNTQLTQLFQNLVSNAIKYQTTGVPQIHVAAAQSVDRKWTFSVADNGMGIDSQYFQKIFGMFQRLHRRDEFAGTGMGLAICKKIVERHGGTISVESEVGRGSTFLFALSESERST
jgi:PAS domain S-box-containing protein